VLLLLAFTATTSAGEINLSNKITSLLAGAFGPNAIASIDIRELESGKQICSFNNSITLVPASVQKCITTICALKTLGPEKCFTTKIYSSAKVSKGIVKGNLIIRGAGDPSLGCNYFSKEHSIDNIISKWVSDTKKANIKEIYGNIIGDGTLFNDQSLSKYAIWEDVGNYYGAITSGLTFTGNMYYLELSSSKIPGGHVRILGTTPPLTSITSWDNRLKAGAKGSGDNAYIFGTPWSPIRLLTGTIPPGRKSFKIKGSLPNPAYTCAAILRNELLKQGIKVRGNAIGKKRGLSTKCTVLLSSHTSPPLKKLVHRANKKSDNVFAEQLFLLTAKKELNSTKWKDGVKSIESILKNEQISFNGVHLKDGSGLSRYNGLTTKFLGDCLVFAAKQRWGKHFINSLPISGTDGSLKNHFNTKLLKGRINAKTGTMERVQSLAGYIKCKSGKIKTISFIVNNHNLSYTAIMKVIQKIILMVENK